jgi:hypothetical protein
MGDAHFPCGTGFGREGCIAYDTDAEALLASEAGDPTP